ncbi:aminoglycoside N(3)-acetyltransferase [Alkalicoccus luteus]|nr:AAC(3) family N-acetyltransferase [Alkalicoccus luteus]
MSMENIVSRSNELQTVHTIKRDLSVIGIESGSTVLVHSSLSSIGWVNGGTQAVIQALMETVTDAGTIVMPSQSGDWSDPADWSNPAVPEQWWNEIRATMPAYDPSVTPTRGMGKIPELFRTLPDVKRSAHPAVSFAAWGKDAEKLTAGHQLNWSFGDDSPLGKLYRTGADVLLIGAGYDSCTAFHLGEYRAPGGKRIESGASIQTDAGPQWVTYEDIEVDNEEFEQVGKKLEAEKQVHTGNIGLAPVKRFSVQDAVDVSEAYFSEMRSLT